MDPFAPMTMDTARLARSFGNYYYGTIINGGWSYVMNAYAPHARCMANGNVMTPHQMANVLAMHGICKARVYKPQMCFMRSRDCLTVHVTCIMALLDSCGYIKKMAFVTDHFRISVSKKKIMEHTCSMRADLNVPIPESTFNFDNNDYVDGYDFDYY